jgi:hypothetical protein
MTALLVASPGRPPNSKPEVSQHEQFSLDRTLRLVTRRIAEDVDDLRMSSGWMRRATRDGGMSSAAAVIVDPVAARAEVVSERGGGGRGVTSMIGASHRASSGGSPGAKHEAPSDGRAELRRVAPSNALARSRRYRSVVLRDRACIDGGIAGVCPPSNRRDSGSIRPAR